MSDPTLAELALAEAVFDDHRTNFHTLIRALHVDATSRGLATSVIRERLAFELITIAALMRPDHLDLIRATTIVMEIADRINNGDRAKNIIDLADSKLN